jgi:hypothetical protein
VLKVLIAEDERMIADEAQEIISRYLVEILNRQCYEMCGTVHSVADAMIEAVDPTGFSSFIAS